MIFILIVTIWINGQSAPAVMEPVAFRTEEACTAGAEKGITALLTDKGTSDSIRAVDFSCVKQTPKTVT